MLAQGSELSRRGVALEGFSSARLSTTRKHAKRPKGQGCGAGGQTLVRRKPGRPRIPSSRCQAGVDLIHVDTLWCEAGSVTMRLPCIVPSQQITSEIVLQIAPDSVDVVRAVLCVVVLHQHGRSVDAVI